MISQSRTRRVLSILLVVVLAAIAVHLFTRIYYFASLFGLSGPHAGIQITQLQVAEAHNVTSPDPRTAVVPKVLHQIFHNWKEPGNPSLPDHWAAARQTCIDLNPGWEFKVWNMAASRTLIEDEFPWFLSTYDGYSQPIQRIDTMKYFILRRYGGIYVDLDNGCASSLDALTYLPAFTTDGGIGALSNNIMGGAPDHPWFHLLTANLIPYNWPWPLPYVAVSYASGQWFVTDMFEHYHRLLSVKTGGVVRGLEALGKGFAPLHHVLMSEQPGADPWVFFTQTRGGTWTQWDSQYFAWVGNHIIQVVLSGLAVALSVVGSFLLCLRLFRRYRSSRKGYKQVRAEEP